jgi:hypothetical protein
LRLAIERMAVFVRIVLSLFLNLTELSWIRNFNLTRDDALFDRAVSKSRTLELPFSVKICIAHRIRSAISSVTTKSLIFKDDFHSG